MNDVDQLLKEAKREVTKLEPGEVFLLHDLFKGYLWNRIKRGDRLLFGSLFLVYAQGSDDLVVDRKGASGQQLYKKK